MGKTGLSISRSLSKSKANIIYWDDDQKVRKQITQTKFKKFFNTSKVWNTIDYVVPSPGIGIIGKSQHKLINIAKKNNKRIISELDLFQVAISKNDKINKNNIKIIAVTGTNGKSTIVTLINHLLKSNGIKTSLIGNIGNSIFSSKLIRNGILIIEVSSYQLETSKIFSPNIAVISNLSSDHLSRHKNMRNYFNQKSKIFKNLTNDDTAILNCNHDLIKSKASKLLKNKKSNTISLNFEKRKSQFYSSKKKLIITSKLRKIKHSNPHLNGEHNEENIQLTYQVLSSLQLKNLSIKKALNSYIGLNHRQELIFDNSKTIIINDSKATNIESMVRAIKNYKNIYLICGGVLKDKNLNMLLPYVNKLKKVYITGVDKNLFINFFSKTNKIFASSNLNEIITKCYKDIDLKKHSTILFCPGAASFDQYKNFEERGKKFKKLITRKFV